MPKSLVKSDGYKTLLNKVRKTLIEGQQRIEQERVRTYWETGRVIHVDILKHKDRAGYGERVVLRLAKDLSVDRSVLNRCVRFAEVYPRLPIGARGHQFGWSHYRNFITVPDDRIRSFLENETAQNDWTAEELAARIKQDRPVLPADDDKPVVQLKFTRGRLHTCQIVPANKALVRQGPLALDLGFREQYEIPKGAPKLKETETVELVFREGTLAGVQKVSVAKEKLFTYVAMVEKVVDGDTLLVSFDFNCPMSVSQKLRLRGIDCPEIDTEEGRRAKRFVESRLKDCDFIIVKTYKDTTDKYDRYLADVFYLPGAGDPSLVASEGTYLNQELLNERLAQEYV